MQNKKEIAEKLREIAGMIDSPDFDEIDIKKLQASHRQIVDSGLKSVRIEMNPEYRSKYISYLNNHARITHYDEYDDISFEGVPVWKNQNIPYSERYHWVVKTKT